MRYKNILICLLTGSLLAGCSGQKEETAAVEQDNTYVPEYACRVIDYYDYEHAVPSSEMIEDSYFNDVMMGGDSRMGSLYLFSDLTDKGAEIHYVTSLSLSAMEVSHMETADATLYDLITSTGKNNVYLLIGINEIRGADFDAWERLFQEFITEFKEAHPNMNIYLILNYHPLFLSDITDEALKERIDDENNRLRNLALANHIYYIDPDEGLDDSEGKIRSDLTWDGLHLNYEGAQLFADYISTHVVRENRYVKEICE